MQAQTGMRTKIENVGAHNIRDHLIDQHRHFFAQLPWLLVGAVDANGQPWAGALAGAPGFVSSPDTTTLQIAAPVPHSSPLLPCLQVGAQVGLLGIEQHTRRRNRANGIVRHADEYGFSVHVQQSFGNCPKYIHPRHAHYTSTASRSASVSACTVEHLSELDAQAHHTISHADTFFIATAISAQAGSVHGADVSHRGGPSGFIQLDEQGALVVPDFAGNSYFNTIGNITLNPRAGLLFVDFNSGDLLHLAVRATVVHHAPLRSLHFDVLNAVRTKGALRVRWE